MLWSALFPFVIPELPGAPEPLVEHYIRQTAIEFCEESQTLQVDIDPVNIVATTGTYSLVAPAAYTFGGDPVMIKWAWVNGQQIYPASQEELNKLTEKWSTKTASFVSNYTQLTQDTVTLFPIPDFSSTGGFTAKIALRPSLAATGLPDWHMNKYIQEIATGTKAAMMGMVGKSWSNTEGEQKYAALFASRMTKATVEGQRSFTRTTQTVRFPRYG